MSGWLLLVLRELRVGPQQQALSFQTQPSCLHQTTARDIHLLHQQLPLSLSRLNTKLKHISSSATIRIPGPSDASLSPTFVNLGSPTHQNFSLTTQPITTNSTTRTQQHRASHTFSSTNMTDAARWKSTIHIGGLAPLVTTQTLQEAFLPFGEIADVSLPRNENPHTAAAEPHRGFAYVEFEDPDDAREAVDNMDQAELFGRVIKVSAAKAPKSAAAGGSGGGLGSRTAVWEQVGAYFLFLFSWGKGLVVVVVVDDDDDDDDMRVGTDYVTGRVVGRARRQRGGQGRR